jgi:hypothetical protein
MNNFRTRERRHGLLKLAAMAMPLLIVIGCSSASSGHAPGVAGGQTLTPGITNFPLAYIKKPVPKTDINVRDLITSITGGDVYIRDQTSAAGAETNITASLTQGKGDVRDLDVSPDGSKLVFSLRLPLDPKKNNTDITQPNWKIYQYDATTKVITQLTNDDTTAGHDVGAHYLPDGRIVFSSTRQAATQAILLDEGRPQYAAQTDDRSQSIFLLHVMNADGTGIHQISFNTNHDFAPSVMNNGQVIFSRWDPEGGADQMSLYRSNPDGTGLELLYGANSHATGANIAGTNNNVIQFLNARQLADGSGVVAIVRPFLGTQFGGDIVKINTDGFVENHQPSTPTGSTAGSGQISATTLGVTTDANMASLGGRFASVFPLYDGTNRMLVSWSPCLVLNTTVTPNTTEVCTPANSSGANVTLAPPQYTLWIYDLNAGTLGPVLSATPNMMVMDPVIMQARTPAVTFIRDATPTDGPAKTLFDKGVGVLNISSVYDVDATDTATPSIAAVSDPSQAAYNARPYRFLRVQKAVEIPGEKIRKISNSDFGPAGMGMREILGYAPIQPDGSVSIQIPANVPFIIDVVDRNAKRVTALGRHTSWLQLLPGETKNCNGCHSTANKTSHGRAGLTVAVNQGAPIAGQPFPNTNPTLITQPAETMAQTLARITCADVGTCSQLLSADVLYSPIWTTGTTPAAADTAIAYTYTGTAGLNEPPPTNASCAPWTAQCRITIHYANDPVKQQFLQSIWNLPGRLAPDHATPATCVTCHTETGAVAATLMVPQGQLDLTGTATSQLDPNVVTSYEQLLFPHNEQALNMAGVPTDLLVPTPGPPDPVTGLPTTVLMPVALAPPMTAGSAAGSTTFLRMFDTTFHDPVLDHTGYLSPAELRLIVEWLDIGGQYYNDPFVAPAAAN